ncbi:MAG TPA: hypothetical protein VFA76_13740 [Terriglobales bacterium]|nr:hypothetical protein [Terriglobales bacterium]
MKIVKTLTVLMPFLLALLPGAHALCSTATAAGTYGFTTSGTLYLPGPVPVGAVGSIIFDLNGNATGSQDRSVGGAIAHEAISGTFSVEPNCSITVDANVYDGNGNLVRSSRIPGSAHQ